MATSLLKNENSISFGDTLYARVTMMGRPVFNLQLCDIESFAQLMSRVRGQLSGISGLVKISLRNASQGWCADHWCNITPACQSRVS